MHFTNFVALTIAGLAGLAAASPIDSGREVSSSSDVTKRGVLIEICLAGCTATCALGPEVCGLCLLGCLGTADDGGEVDIDKIKAFTNDLNQDNAKREDSKWTADWNNIEWVKALKNGDTQE